MRPFITALFLVFVALSSFAQIENTMLMKDVHNTLMPASKTISITPPLSKAATIQSKDRAYFGKLLPCNIRFMEESTATPTADGTTFTLSLTSHGAYSIGLRTSGLTLSDGSVLYVYNNDRDDILGALTNDVSDLSLLTRQIQGDTINIELFVPKGVAQEDFEITAICYDYANMFGKYSKGYGSNESCSTEVNINCDAGQPFQDIKHSVVLISVDDGMDAFACTGSIVNNIKCDQTPYVLTAAHCVCEQYAADNTVVYFNYENVSCGTTSSISPYYSMTGGTIVATAPKKKYTDQRGRTSSTLFPALDFTLLRLKQNIPEEYLPYYAGLSISTTDNLSSVATIHHPQGDTKKISISRSKPYQDSYPAGDSKTHYDNFSHWHVERWDVGTTEGGSSGAPLLNLKKQIVGILSGGYADCTSPVDDSFQMISKAWNSYSKRENQLKASLASGTNVTEILPYNPLNLNEKYLPATLEAELSDDSSSVLLSWQTHKNIFGENFDSMQSTEDVDMFFYANVSMDYDYVAWSLSSEASHSGNFSIKNVANSYRYSGDYFTIPNKFIHTGDTLRFWAKVEKGVSSLVIGQSAKNSRFNTIKTFKIEDTEWNEYKISLDKFAGTSIYINISHLSANGNSQSTVFIDDISISNDSENAPHISGYEIYDGDHLIQTVADTAMRSYSFDLLDDSTYTFYVLNQYSDGGISNIGNSVVIDLSDPVTATTELKYDNAPLIAFPNPTTGMINITVPHNIENSEIAVIDVTGRKVMSQKINNIPKGENIELSLAALRPGVYIIRLGGQSIKIQKQ